MSKNLRGRVIAVLAIAGALGAAAVPAASAAPAQQHHHYALGALVSPTADHTRTALAVHSNAALPASVDLSNYIPTVGDQGQVGSCVAWAIDYSAFTVLEGEEGIQGAPHAPMYTYAQIAQGDDEGSYASQHFSILTSQGLDTKADYWQGDFDYTTQPDANETANAANWKLSGYTALNTGSALQNEVKSALAQGEPVVFAFEVYQSLEDISATTAANYTYYPTSSELRRQPLGGHEVAIVGYNSQGVKIANSWGSSWGANGYFTVPWKFVTNQIEEADAVGSIVATGQGIH
ncbi:C1 family peptidase [Kitasatospora sp. NBC_01287]|uniref:C1 family peptidase n=1 Tax=Kitasatospora sp. NBC_01287 TaxID=2903573 RepID=UPI00224EC7EF|nr:C1 family peptidase [Kitasatospora sp. NBC_01287]MCX4744114.1 C1 family peptidase [Kitasatospora sp. NBC_01287]